MLSIVVVALATGKLTWLLVKDTNGREFSWHEKLAENLDCNTYFAKPYHSWERGLNENHNGLLRQFFPKRMALDNVSEKEAFRATDLMNNRPRKCLGYKTPFPHLRSLPR
ncbi:Mobile element protein [uncultured Gammaproteobacteria bacterium]|nr:Mobile element protein [uncultured Gammaproteobacteria bacterium]